LGLRREGDSNPRTHVSRSTVFETAPFDHSGISPESKIPKMLIIQAGIFPENTASIKLHRKYGCRIVGTREKIGKLDWQWRDIILMERRSKKTGID
jgi:L-amino acid N-acyltransferase YncA